MKITKLFFILITGTILLSSCASMDRQEYVYRRYTGYQPDLYRYDNLVYYGQSYESGANYSDGSQSIYTSSNQNLYNRMERVNPASHKDLDRSWVKNQNPQSYTIELANGEKASQVAGKLYKAPKADRRAQIKYYENGKVGYKGVYGSYPSYEAAQKAMNNLPDELKQGAGIKNWSSVQSNMGN